MYDPTIGRWLQEDPIGFAGGDINLYRYVGNGPTSGTDPSGLQPPPRIGIVGQTQPTPGRLTRLLDSIIRHPFPAIGAAPVSVPNVTLNNSIAGDAWYLIRFLAAQPRDQLLANHTLPILTPRRVWEGANLRGGANGVGGGSHTLFPPIIAPGEFVGTGGCEGSVGLIISSPSGTAVFHFGTSTQDARATISQYHWPAGSHAIMCGGNDDLSSRLLMEQIIDVLSANRVRLDGIANTTNCWLGSDGNWYVIP